MQSHALLLTNIVVFTFAPFTWAQGGDREYLEQCGARINNGSFANITRWDQAVVMELLSHPEHKVMLQTNFDLLCGANRSCSSNTSMPLPLNEENIKNLMDYIMAQAQNKTFHIQIPVWVCESLCAGKRGWIFYPPADIVARFWMWMLPLFVLLANIHFAPLGWLNALCVTAHILGDPIDFMGSLNTRLEVGSRLYKYWKQSNLNYKHFDERMSLGNGNDDIQLADSPSSSFPSHVHRQQGKSEQSS